MSKKCSKEEMLLRKNRIEMLHNRILEKESIGGEAFFEDIENDPESREIKPDEVDYLYKKPSSKIKAFIAELFANKLYKTVKKTNQIELVGEENLIGFEGGAILTGNHFHFFDSGNAMHIAYKLKKRKKLFRVVKEGNFFMKGLFGFLLKNSHTLPLSSNMKTMMKFNKAIETLLNEGNLILIYPEQSMWWNYRKPRPHRIGAAHYAAKHNVPIISYFVTMEDLNTFDDNGEPNQKYTIHVLPLIYPDKDKSVKENEIEMTKKNYDSWVQVYEETYNKKLVY